MEHSAARFRRPGSQGDLTLPHLEPGGAGSTPATCGPCPGRSADRSELRDGVGLRLAVATVHRFRADGGPAAHIPVRPRPAAQPPLAAPARRGGLDVPTVTTGSRRIRLVDPLDHHADTRRLLALVAGKLPVRPLAALLVADRAQADPVWRSRACPTARCVTPSTWPKVTTVHAAWRSISRCWR